MHGFYAFFMLLFAPLIRCATGTLAVVCSIGGITISKTITKTADAAKVFGDANTLIALAAGKAVTDWVKTDADTAACNLPAGHGYTDGNFDVYWSGGVRYNVPGTIVTNALTLDGGAGDAFPESAEEDVVVCSQQQVNAAIDGDELEMMGVLATQRAHVNFQESDDTVVAAIELQADEPYTWHSTSGLTNPLTGDPVTKALVSNGTTTAAVLTILVLEDSTP